MQSFVLVGLSLLAVASAANYHIDVGIPAAAAIKKAEEEILAKGGNVQSRIVGGNEAALNVHPYLAGLLISFTDFVGLSVCSASLISSTRLVTAAQCWTIANMVVKEYEVVLGSHFLFSGGLRLQTSDVVVHPLYSIEFSTQFDVAVIKLPTEVTFSASIQPIKLPYEILSERLVGEEVIAAGYGKTNDAQPGVPRSSVVHEVKLNVMSINQCVSTYGPFVLHPVNSMCTFGTGGVGICAGDTGGPLVYNHNGTDLLVGISCTHVRNRCESGYPSVYSRVTAFYDFIVEHME